SATGSSRSGSSSGCTARIACTTASSTSAARAAGERRSSSRNSSGMGFLRERRRRRLRAAPFPDDWRAIIERRFAMFSRLSEADRAELLGHVAVFLDEKKFEGCAGLVITDEIRVTVAAQACLLLLHRE